MKKSNLSARLLPALFVAGALVFTGCSDSDYDFGNIDSTIGIGSDGLQIPVSTTENIKLGDILELEENGSVVEAANGDYVFRQDGGNVAPVHPFIDKIVVWKKSEPIITPVPVGIPFPTKSKGVRRNDSYVGDISGTGYLVEFHYRGEKPADVIEMKKAELKAPVTLRLKFDDNIKRSIQKFQELSLTFPNYMELADNGSLMTPTVNGRKVVFNDVPTSKDLVVKVNIKTIDFKAKQEYPGSSIKINGKDIQIPCTLDDIGEEYEYTLDYPFSGNSNGKGIFSVALMQDGSIIGTVKVEADSVDNIDRKSKIRQISAAQSSSDKKGMSIAGVKCGDDKTEVKKVFGEPDSPDADAWKYKKRGFLATFFFDDDGKVTMLSISDIDDEDT